MTPASPAVDPKEIVRTGYDAISYAYRGDAEDAACAAYHQWLDELLPLVPAGTPVLDLGCGCGIPVARRLAATHPLTGVDLSPIQIERARRNVPGTTCRRVTFLCADMATVSFPPEHFAAIVCLYAIIHLPLDEQPDFLQNLYRWLRPGGYLLATVGHRAWTGQEQDWLGAGATMYWSHAGEETYVQWLEDRGFDLLWTRFVPEDDSGHTLVLGRRPL